MNQSKMDSEKDNNQASEPADQDEQPIDVGPWIVGGPITTIAPEEE